MASEGWIKLYRNIQEHWIWEEAQKLKWWLDILLLANHKERKIPLGNEIMQVERGAFHTSELKLAERWGVSKNTVRRFLEMLESDSMIELKKSKKGTTIKVSNYKDFQDFSDSKKTIKELQSDHDVNHEVTMNETDKEPYGDYKVNTNNNDKNIKNDKEGEEGKENVTFPPTLSTHQILIKEQFGDVAYKTWFETTEIIEDQMKVFINVPNEFNKNVILTKYKTPLEKLFNKRIELEVSDNERSSNSFNDS